MEFEFDKEIDVLLRQAAQGSETAFADSKSPHLDADEISAFAENAVPEKTKTLFTAHFADCSRCRKLLSNVIALNAETQTETARVKEKETAAPAAIAWYRKLFAAPSLAYAMGALVLVFAGLIAFTFLKNAPQTAEVSRVIEKPVNMGGASSDGETVTTEITEPTGAMSNSGAMSSNTAMKNSAQSNSAAMRDGFASNASTMSNSASLSNSTSGVAAAKDEAKNKSETQLAATPVQQSENQARGSNFAVQEQPPTANKEKARDAEDADKMTAESPTAASKPAAPKTDAAAPAPPAKSSTANARSATALSGDVDNKKARRAEAEKTATRQVGGKNFRRDGSVWYDADYSGQSTRDVARGTESYRKLDSGLRSIAETLSGTIVVVWKSRAYRIQ